MQKHNLGFKLIAAVLPFESCVLYLWMFSQILPTSPLMNLTFTGRLRLFLIGIFAIFHPKIQL